MSLLKSDIRKAISNIVLRADSQPSIEDIQGTYVDNGIIQQVVNVNDQIIFGRRGTGKTHLLKYAGPKLEATKKNGISSFIDMRTLSSASEMASSDISLEKRCFAVIRDICRSIHGTLSDHALNYKSYKNIPKILDEFGLASSGYETNKTPVRSLEKTGEESRNIKAGKAGFKSSLELNISGDIQSEKKENREGETEYSYENRKTVRYSNISKSLKSYLNELDAHLFIIIDEWSSIPLELQPDIAEFVKRVLLCENKVSVKIGAIRARTNLRDQNKGMELGADISSSINLDDFYIFDRDPEVVTEVFEKILFNHLTNSLGTIAIFNERIATPDKLVEKIFTRKTDFIELVISAEGVIRDFMNIFNKCINTCYANSYEKIRNDIVRNSALIWYREDKRGTLDESEKDILKKIVRFCVQNGVRAFLAPISFRNHAGLQRLVDLRTVHSLVSSIDLDMDEFDLYTIDYGAYADMGNSESPAIQRMTATKKGENSIKPFPHDSRWISYIKLK